MLENWNGGSNKTTHYHQEGMDPLRVKTPQQSYEEVCPLVQKFGTAKHVLVLSWLYLWLERLLPSGLVWLCLVFGRLIGEVEESRSTSLLVLGHSLLSHNISNWLLLYYCWRRLASPAILRGFSSSWSAWSSGAARRGWSGGGERQRGRWWRRQRWHGRWCAPPQTAPFPPASLSGVLGPPSWSLAHLHPSCFFSLKKLGACKQVMWYDAGFSAGVQFATATERVFVLSITKPDKSR